ncbi:MAG: DUF2207 domain-containing protein, partial [Bacteroidota bacterium]
NGIISFPDHQEFYYDLTGNEWQAPIYNVNYTINLPKGITLSESDMKITGGYDGQNQEFADIRQVGPQKIQGSTFRSLGSRQGISAAVRFPKAYLDVANNNVTFYEQPEEKVESNPWYIAIPLAIFGFFVNFWNRMRKTNYVEDPKGVNPYPPEGLTSAHVGAFVDQIAHTRDIVSLLPYWGAEGFLEMKQVTDEVFLYKIKNLPPDYPEYEHIIFDRLFQYTEVAKLSDLKTKFYTTMYEAQKSLTAEVRRQEYYDPKYLELFRSWRVSIFPLAMIALGIGSLVLYGALLPALGFFTAALGGLILPFMKLPLTDKGARLKYEIEAFRRFLKNPDAKKIDTAIKEDANYFDKMFPFAVAFGIEKTFLTSLEPHMTSAPYWYYHDNTNASYSTFSSNFKPEVIQSAFTSAPAGTSGSSSGGGFSSGGGVGGGGGSSW